MLAEESMSPDHEIPRQDSNGELFEDLPLSPAQPLKAAPRAGKARVVMPDRSQMELRAMDLESLLPAGHHARQVWAWVQQQDLSAM
jgi:hypothetical protein